MLHIIPHEVSEGLRRENAAHDQLHLEQHIREFPVRYPSLDAYLAEYQRSLSGTRFLGSLPAIPARSRVLDIGVGQGGSSIALAARGHRVSAVEPNLSMCRYLERAAAVFGLELDIYCTTAEALDRLPGDAYDCCVFNASFHHCDDPVGALSHCQRLLAPQGTILLLNEPVLKIFNSKARFYRRLEESPKEMGHYGGNEHIYYYHEYVQMLRRAGFTVTEGKLASVYRQPDEYLHQLRSSGVKGSKILARRAWYRLINGIACTGSAGQSVLGVLQRLSLLATDFRARKPAA